MFKSVHSVMFFVPSVEEACRWYSDLLTIKPEYLLPDFPVLRVGSVEICQILDPFGNLFGLTGR